MTFIKGLIKCNFAFLPLEAVRVLFSCFGIPSLIEAEAFSFLGNGFLAWDEHPNQKARQPAKINGPERRDQEQAAAAKLKRDEVAQVA